MVNPNLAMVQKYEEEHGYILAGGAVPLWRDYEVAVTDDSGKILIEEGKVITETKTGMGKQVVEMLDLSTLESKIVGVGVFLMIGLVLVTIIAVST